jgi:hypothetical protein
MINKSCTMLKCSTEIQYTVTRFFWWVQ